MIHCRVVRLALCALCLGAGAVAPIGVGASQAGAEPRPNTPIEHFIVLMQENHSFDNYFGTYPGADGIPADTCMPVDPTDPTNEECIPPFHIGNQAIEDLDHSQGIHLRQYRDANMDGFVHAYRLRNKDGSLTMGYYDDRDLPYYWNIADEYVLFDRFFSSAAGGSVRNHLYWVAGSPGTDDVESDGTPEGGWGDLPTIFDRLEERGISWKFYVQNYDPAITFRYEQVAGQQPRPQVVWVPLLNYARYVDDPELFSHIVDLEEYYIDLQNGTLPAVSYIVPSGASEHPPGSIQAGQRFVKTLITELMRSDVWESSAFLWTYDDWGGWYDHVPPRQVDPFGYGFRVPALLVSPYAKRGYIDSTELDYTSILKFIEENYDLQPLAERDARANSITSAFDFSQPPREPRIIPSTREVGLAPSPRRSVITTSYAFALALPGIVIAGAIVGSGFRHRRSRPGGRRSQPKDGSA